MQRCAGQLNKDFLPQELLFARLNRRQPEASKGLDNLELTPDLFTFSFTQNLLPRLSVGFFFVMR